MYKKLLAIVCSSLILLSGCLPLDNLKRDEVEKEDTDENEKAIPIPNVNSQEEYYKSLKNYEPGVARGEISFGVDNRIDVDELVTGLMRLSKDTFSIEDYYFQEGQYISKETIRNWLGRSSEKFDKESSSGFLQQGLNPGINQEAYDNADVDKRIEMLKDEPKMLSYILEQNYLKDSGEDSVKLGGISIALSFNSTYYYTVEDDQGFLHRGDKNLDNSKVKEFAYETGQEVVNRLRQHPELQDVPIVIGLYMEKEHGAVVPGNYFAKAVVKGGQTSIDWEKVNEQYYFFPSDKAEEDHREDYAVFTQFEAEIKEYFPNYIGVIGKALYRDDKIAKMTIEIPMQFKGKAEIISFTQYVNYLVKQYYPDEVVEVNIKSSVDKIESLIISDPSKDDSMVHIY